MDLDSAKTHLSLIAMNSRGLIRSLLSKPKPTSPFDVFLSSEALKINEARQCHLASLNLELEGKRVLEVGAGIGLHTNFFLEKGCEVLVSDGNQDNVAEIKRRHPELTVECIDLEKNEGLTHLGCFDIVYCYGLLYHLMNPQQAIRNLATICSGQILLETCVIPTMLDDINYVREPNANNQATSGIGCRPSREWVLRHLRTHFGHAYVTDSQPDHLDFPNDWDAPPSNPLYRAVFVGSQQPLSNPQLLTEVPQMQRRFNT